MIIDYEFKCCICGKHITNEYGNNPYPIYNAGECCNICNMLIVLPARIKKLNSK